MNLIFPYFVSNFLGQFKIICTISRKKIIDRFFLHNIYLQFYYKNEKYKFIIPLSCDLYNCLNKLQNFKYYSDIYNFNKTLLKSKIN